MIDAVFAVKTASGYEPVALELELSAKNARRMADVLHAYVFKSKSFTFLWYVVTDPAFGKRLVKLWQEINPHALRPIFGWISLRQLLTDPFSCVVNFSDDTIQLGQLSSSEIVLLPAQTPAHPVSITF